MKCPERGSVTVVAAAMMAIIATLVLGSADVWRVLEAKSRAQTAADAAALAAAQSLALPDGGAPVEAAMSFAAANGGELRSCSCDPGRADAVVEVSVDVGDLVFIPGSHSVTARAMAVSGAG